MVNSRYHAGSMLAAGIGALVLAASPALGKEWGHQKDPSKYVDHLDKKLDLTDEQRASIQPIVTEFSQRADGLKEQLASLRKEKHEKIRGMLTPEQAAKFDQMGEKQHGKKHDETAND